MKQSIEDKCRLFVENRDQVKRVHGGGSIYMYPLCAAIYTMEGKRAEKERLEGCVRILKDKTGFFSNFRGIGKLSMASMLDVSGNPEGLLEQSLEVYDLLKEKFVTSSYLPVAAMILARLGEPSSWEKTVERARGIYNCMKAEHPFLTASEDSIYAALMALVPGEEKALAEEANACYEQIKPYFFSSNSVQSLGQVLALDERGTAEKCARTMELYDKLKERGCKYGTNYELPTLGVLALTAQDVTEAVEDILQADAFLEGQKGFGAFGIGKKQRLMYAGMLTQEERQAGSRLQTAALGGTISLIIAQQAAMCAAIAASSAAASSSYGGNN